MLFQMQTFECLIINLGVTHYYNRTFSIKSWIWVICANMQMISFNEKRVGIQFICVNSRWLLIMLRVIIKLFDFWMCEHIVWLLSKKNIFVSSLHGCSNLRYNVIHTPLNLILHWSNTIVKINTHISQVLPENNSFDSDDRT